MARTAAISLAVKGDEGIGGWSHILIVGNLTTNTRPKPPEVLLIQLSLKAAVRVEERALSGMGTVLLLLSDTTLHHNFDDHVPAHVCIS